MQNLIFNIWTAFSVTIMAQNRNFWTINIIKNKVMHALYQELLHISQFLLTWSHQRINYWYGLPLFLKYRMALKRITREMLWHFNIKCWWCDQYFFRYPGIYLVRQQTVGHENWSEGENFEQTCNWGFMG